MNLQAIRVAAAAAAIFGFAGIAEASTLDISASYGGTWLAGSTVYTFDNGQPSNLSLSNAAIVTGSSSGLNAAPWVGGANGGPDQTPYVAVYTGGTATLTLNAPSTYLGVLWGSVDTDPGRNLITLYNGSTVVGTVQGSDLAALLPDLITGGGANWFYQGTVYANITSSVAFNKVVFSDIPGSNAFELDNVAVSAVPLPAALPLFASGVLGLGAWSRWRKAKRTA